jgi:2-polyprenyl-3-methyl-5-hydroxy-6-metoxy-1,4-benzoquinol methylase
MAKDFNPSYVGLRGDVIEALLACKPQPGRVLDVGCATGEVGRYIKQVTGSAVDGVEVMPDMAAEAATKLDNVFVGPVEQFLVRQDRPVTYDAIILADVLEHTQDPWSLLKQFRALLSNDGIIVISLPNVRHWSTIYSVMVRGVWPYRDRGIHDRTHLRFFTLANIKELVSSANMVINLLKRNLRIDEGFGKINRLSALTNIPGVRAFFVFQYILVCSASPEGGSTS